MKKLGLLLCLALMPGVSSHVGANEEEGDDLEQIPSCGSMSIETDVWQAGNYLLYVEGYSQSRRAMDGCASKMRVEAWVDGTSGGVAIHEGYGVAVTVAYGRAVPSYKDYTGIGKHWLINFGMWLWGGQSSNTTPVVPKPPPPKEPDDEPPPEDEDPIIAPDDPSCPPGTCGSPLLFDRDGDGFHLTSAQDGVLFDINADGVLDQVAWTRADSGDAWLALDRNGNGQIDDGGELFGNATPAYANQRLLKAMNGFDALGFLQAPDYGRSYTDAVIDQRDAMFGRLLLWTDSNHNGISEPGELQVARDAGLIHVGIPYTERKRRDQHGNEFRLIGQSQWLNDKGFLRSEVVVDVWLRIAR